MPDSPIPPELVHCLQVTAAIDALEEYCNRITTDGVEHYLQIKHDLIKQLEEKHESTE